MFRAPLCAALLFAPPLAGQRQVAVDSIVARITRAWGPAPRGGWCAEWSIVRGDSSALRADAAEISGSDRAGIYTVTVRAARFAAPVLIGRLRLGYERQEPVAARTIARGTLLAEQDVLVRHMLVWGAPDSVASPTAERLIGFGNRHRGEIAAAAALQHAGKRFQSGLEA